MVDVAMCWGGGMSGWGQVRRGTRHRSCVGAGLRGGGAGEGVGDFLCSQAGGGCEVSGLRYGLWELDWVSEGRCALLLIAMEM